MSNNQPGLWWAFDEENGSFAPLPAGPLLIPAIFVYAILSLFGPKGVQRNRPERFLPQRVIDSAQYRRDTARYRYLVDKKFRFGLTDWEEIEMDRLSRPSWNNHQPWPYPLR